MMGIFVSFVGLVLCSFPSGADEPMEPATEIWSNNKQYRAIADLKRKTTSINHVDTNGIIFEEWSMYGTFAGQASAISDNGEYLVAGYWGMNLLPVEYDTNEIMLYFFKRGELIKYVTLGDLVFDIKKLKRTKSHYHWGGYRGFNKDGQYEVETVEQGIVLFDPGTGQRIQKEIRFDTDRFHFHVSYNYPVDVHTIIYFDGTKISDFEREVGNTPIQPYMGDYFAIPLSKSGKQKFKVEDTKLEIIWEKEFELKSDEPFCTIFIDPKGKTAGAGCNSKFYGYE